jgi:hypothetical protein
MAAQFKGHCQWCGSLQKLPSNRLSLHGYSVTHGFFSGVCHGAKHDPIEVSCDLVKASILEAKRQIAQLQAEQAKWLAPVAEGEREMWASVYLPATWQIRRSRYEWRRVTLLATPVTVGEGQTFHTYTYQTEVNGKTTTHRIYEHANTPEQTVQTWNAKYAGALGREVTVLERYIAWQQARVDAWKPMPLLPVDAKAAKDAAFDPASK